MKSRILVVLALSILVAVAIWRVFRPSTRAIPRAAIAHASGPGKKLGHLSPPRAAPVPGEEVQEQQPDPGPLAVDLDGPPRWHPRPAGEWDGMLVNMNWTPPCETTELCGLGLACKGGKCMPCVGDADCAAGEACVLDHCLPSARVGCRHASDCPSNNLCVLSGYSATPRGNEDMSSECVGPLTGAAYGPEAPNDPPPKDPRTSLPNDELLKAAREAALSK